MSSRGSFWGICFVCILGLCLTLPVLAKVQYSNDFENPFSDIVTTAWQEWWPAGGAEISARAVNGRIEWDDSSGGDRHWLALDMPLPMDFVVEFDFFYDSRTNGRFSFWPLAPATVEGATIHSHHNYFMRKNTHYFNGSDTIPSEGPRDLTLPEGSPPHRLRFEVSGDHVVFLYQDQGQGPWVKIDERDFPPFGDEIRNIQLGFNKDSGGAAGGIQYIDNIEISYDDPPLDYSNNFDDPSSELPPTAWPEWVDSGGNTARAVNGRIEWYDSSGGDNNWLRLNVPLRNSYYMEFDFLYDARTNGRFSVWPRVPENGATIHSHHNYFIRKNTHYFNGGDTIPSEGPRDMTLPEGSIPHRLRFEVTGDHVVFLYKDQGQGPWIKVDERDFPAFGDGISNIQLGMNKDPGGELGGVHYIDNFELHDFGSSEVTVDRFIDANSFTAEASVPIRLELAVSGSADQTVITELLPERWSATGISNGGILERGLITWTLADIPEATTLTYNAVAPRLVVDVIANFSGAINGARVEGETVVELALPYLFREAVDYNFSGSPVDGKSYPMGAEKGELYAEGLDGVLSSKAYFYPGWDVNEFVFPAGEDFYFSGTGTVRDGSNVFAYRNPNEINITSVAFDSKMGINGLAAGDWFRYTFDFGEGEQILFANYFVNTWNIEDEGWVDVYLDNQRIAETAAPATVANGFDFLTAGPVAVEGGVHDLVIAFPAGAATPGHFARIEVILSDGIGSVTRTLPDATPTAGTALDVTLTAKALMGSVAIEIEETVPEGASVSDISDGGVLDGNIIRWTFDTMTSDQDNEKTVRYKVTPADGVEALNFHGIAGVGKALADKIEGDNVLPKPVEVVE